MQPESDFLFFGKNGQQLTNGFLNCFSLVPFGFFCWPFLRACRSFRSFSTYSMARMSSSESGTSTRRSTSVEELSDDGVNFELTFSCPSQENLERGPQGRPYGNSFHSSAEVQHQAIQNPEDHQIRRLHEPPRAIIPSYHRRMNMRVVVDLEALFPDGAYDYHTGQLVDNLENIHIFTFTSYTQLQDLNVDYLKSAIQELCWECFGSPLRKRDFKLWLQVLPPLLPRLPYGRFEALNYDNFWIEVMNAHQIPFGQSQILLRAHRPESIFD